MMGIESYVLKIAVFFIGNLNGAECYADLEFTATIFMALGILALVTYYKLFIDERRLERIMAILTIIILVSLFYVMPFSSIQLCIESDGSVDFNKMRNFGPFVIIVALIISTPMILLQPIRLIYRWALKL